MIKYCGRAISWVQYLLCKPIKHGIKGLVLACAITGYVYSFEIYTGKDDELDCSPVGVVSHLIKSARLVGIGGVSCILYTDNWYTSIDLLQHSFKTYGFLIVGTYSLMKKLSRMAVDFPFHHLSNAAAQVLPHGWCHHTTHLFNYTQNQGQMVAQATI